MATNNKEYMREYMYKRSKTLNGRCSDIYSQQIKSCRYRNHEPPAYTRQEFYTWIESQPGLIPMYQAWVNSDYNKDLSPSVDRLRNDESYSFNNIELVTWKENKRRADESCRDGELIKNLKHRSVRQLTLNGELIAEYISVSAAKRAVGDKNNGVSNALNGRYKTCLGFKWEYIN